MMIFPSRKSGDDDKLLARDLNVDVLEIVDACAFDAMLLFMK